MKSKENDKGITIIKISIIGGEKSLIEYWWKVFNPMLKKPARIPLPPSIPWLSRFVVTATRC